MKARKQTIPQNRKQAVRIEGNDAISRLYRAVLRYVESKGGKLLVIGGIQVQRWPEDGEYNFRIAVKCTGSMPEYSNVMAQTISAEAKADKDKKCRRAKGLP